MASDSIDDYVASVARALGLTIEDAWRPAVRSNLEVSLRMARLVDEFPLPDESEPAGIFSA
jgi:1-carboxybiuret hydrolase subunit AtzG-like protein